MKKYFKYGIGLILPLALVCAVLWWLYGIFANLTMTFLPATMVYHWWFTCIVLAGIVIAIILIGMIFSLIKPLRWIKEQVEKYIIKRIPIVSTIYNFGKEVSNSFVTDIKEGGNFPIVEIETGIGKMLGVLTDETNNIVFVISAPIPSSGFIIKTDKYKKLDMDLVDNIQINASLGKVKGNKWK